MKILRICVSVDGWLEADKHQTLYVARYIGNPEPAAGDRIYAEDEEALSEYPFLIFHAHNDYDLAVSNVLAAVLSGVRGLHTTINGLGERAGNAPLSSVQAILKDHFNAMTNIDESRLNDVSRVVESYSGIVIPANKPIVGENVFTQVAGVHADGDNKNNLYCNDLLPERFGRKREYALGKQVERQISVRISKIWDWNSMKMPCAR